MSNVAGLIGVPAPTLWEPIDKQQSFNCTNPELVVGVEIETERCQNIVYTDHMSKLWQMKTDGSLRGTAFEFVSKPVKIKYLIPQLAKFYADTGFTEENYSDRCSVHIHTNITDMTVEQVSAICLVYSIVEELLFNFVNKYHAKDTWGYSRDTNIYCVPWAQCRMNHGVVKNMFADPNYAFRNWQKYTALNLLPAREIGTLEWRHMHGTADVDKLTKWLNIIGSIIKYAQGRSLDEVIQVVKELNDSSAYQQFYNEIFQDALPYTEEYSTAIYAGVVNAKYALMGFNDDDKAKLKRLSKRKRAVPQEGYARVDGLRVDAWIPPEGGIARMYVADDVVNANAVQQMEARLAEQQRRVADRFPAPTQRYADLQFNEEDAE
jgi:Putative amidoligase enzyme.